MRRAVLIETLHRVLQKTGRPAGGSVTACGRVPQVQDDSPSTTMVRDTLFPQPTPMISSPFAPRPGQEWPGYPAGT